MLPELIKGGLNVRLYACQQLAEDESLSAQENFFFYCLNFSLFNYSLCALAFCFHFSYMCSVNENHEHFNLHAQTQAFIKMLRK